MPIIEIVSIFQAVGGLTKYFLNRFYKLIEEIKEDFEKFKTSIQSWVKEQAELLKDSKILTYTPRIVNTIIELLDMRTRIKEVEKTDEPDEIIDFFCDYARNWLFLDKAGARYLRVALNWDITTDYFDSLNLKLYDVYSDITLMGLICLEILREQIGEEIEDYVFQIQGYVLCESLKKFLDKAAKVAEEREDQKEEHLKFIQTLSDRVDFHLAYFSGVSANNILKRGEFEGSRALYHVSEKAYERLSLGEKNQQDKNELEARSEYHKALAIKALALGWLEIYSLKIQKIHDAIRRRSFRDRLLKFVGIGVKQIEKMIETEQEIINDICHLFQVQFDQRGEDLVIPEVKTPDAVIQLPVLNLSPPPLD